MITLCCVPPAITICGRSRGIVVRSAQGRIIGDVIENFPSSLSKNLYSDLSRLPVRSLPRNLIWERFVISLRAALVRMEGKRYDSAADRLDRSCWAASAASEQ